MRDATPSSPAAGDREANEGSADIRLAASRSRRSQGAVIGVARKLWGSRCCHLVERAHAFSFEAPRVKTGKRRRAMFRTVPLCRLVRQLPTSSSEECSSSVCGLCTLPRRCYVMSFVDTGRRVEKTVPAHSLKLHLTTHTPIFSKETRVCFGCKVTSMPPRPSREKAGRRVFAGGRVTRVGRDSAVRSLVLSVTLGLRLPALRFIDTARSIPFSCRQSRRRIRTAPSR